jgi:N6-adenosine-specific RNA methylase IME4
MGRKKGVKRNSAQISACLSAFPIKRKYDVILIDPPWPYSRSKCKLYKGSVPYDTMNLSEIGALPIATIAKPNCALFLWVTAPYLPASFSLLETWGFQYKTVFLVWRKVYKSGKPRCGLGWYTRPCHEYMLISKALS